MSSQAVKAGKAEVEVSIRDRVGQALIGIQRRLQGAGQTIAKFGGALAGSASIGAGAFIGLAKSFADSGSELDDMSQRTGASVENLSRLKHVAEMSGASLSDVGSAMEATTKSLSDGINGQTQAYQKLGLSTASLLAMSPEDRFLAISQSLQRIPSQVQRSAMAMEVFGSAGEQLLPMLNENIAQLIGNAEELGLVMSSKDAAAAADLNDAFGTLGNVVKKAGEVIGAAVTPILKEVADRAITVVSSISKWINQNRELVRILFIGVAAAVAVGIAIATIGGALAAAGAVIGGFVSAVSGIVAAFVAVKAAVIGAIGFLSGAWVPLLLGAGILIALAAAAFVFRDQLIEAFSTVRQAIQPVIDSIARIWGVFSETFGAIISALGSGQLEDAASIAWIGFQAVAWTAMEELSAALQTGLDYLQGWIPGLDSIIGYVKQTFGGIYESIMAGRWDLAGQILMAKLQLVWTNGVDFLKDVWDMFTTGLKMSFRMIADFISNVWHGAVDGIARGIAWIMEKTGLAAKGTLAQLEQMQAAEEKARAKERSGREDPIQTMGKRMMEREAMRNQMRANIASLESQASQAYSEAGSPNVAVAAAAARERLAKTIKKTEVAREEAAKKAPGPKLQDGPIQMTKFKTEGSFTAAAAVVLGGGNSVNEKIEQNTRAMARGIASINDNTKRRGATK
jgi:hypothetical protein